MRITTNVRVVLTALLADEARIRDEHQRASELWHRDRFAYDRHEYGQIRARCEDLERLGVPSNLGGWLGHEPSPSDSASFSRTTRTMEAAGLIERHNWLGGHRTTHIKLTPAGEKVAKRIVGGAAAK